VATFLAGAVRVYFGVHSVSQVAWGWLFGAALVVAAAALERPFLRWWACASPLARWSVALLPALLLLGCGLLLRELLYPGQTPPPDWATRHRSAVLRLTPLGVAADLVLLDALALARWAGALLGASLAGLYYGGSAARQVEVLTWRARAIHTLLGLACGGTVLLAGELLVRRVGAPGELLRFALLLLAVGVLAPRVGRRLDRRRAAGANAAPRAVV
ncbi:MAG TPA: hypothetical protein VMS86_11090, partial [Thermoanaerobaculia bacterium]|nr:hypothetical protein [Thermoanaerobaculia bacterium]